MKTLKILVIFFILGVFGFSAVEAQNKVKKTERESFVYAYLDCAGEWVFGNVIVEDIISPHNWLILVKKVEVKGYLDEACTLPSGNVYELSQVAPGSSAIDWEGHDGWWENTGKFTLNGKIVLNFHEKLHMSTNANGDVTVDFWEIKADCK
jgi:hypothetical protein